MQANAYADEADLLNVVLFGLTAKQWQEQNRNKSGNMRDYATINQLLVLANLESYNAMLIGQNIMQPERMVLLRKLVVQQLSTLEKFSSSALPQLRQTEKQPVGKDGINSPETI